MKKLRIGIILLLFVFSFFLQANSDDITQILNEIFSVASPTGYEDSMVSTIQKLLPADLSFEKDSLGSLYLALGDGGEHLAVLTGIDETGYFVSGFDSRGYLNLDRAVSVATPLFDSFQFGHPMTIWTQAGPVSGVLALPSLHIISREMRNDLQNIFSLENALVDIGVRSKKEAQARGIEMLDPVTPLARISQLAGDRKSGPSLGTKVCTSLLLDVAVEASLKSLGQKTTFVWMAQTKYPARRSRPRAALGAVLAKKNLSAVKFLIVGIYPLDNQVENHVSLGAGPVLVTSEGSDSDLNKIILDMASRSNIPLQNVSNIESMLLAPFLSSANVSGMFVPVKFSATPNEVIDFRDVRSLVKLISSILQ
jgi:putative aminopeptidase FrvX